MSGQAYYYRDFIQWGYVALICVVLAFTAMTNLVAGTAPSDDTLVSTPVNPNVCVIPEKANSS